VHAQSFVEEGGSQTEKLVKVFSLKFFSLEKFPRVEYAVGGCVFIPLIPGIGLCYYNLYTWPITKIINSAICRRSQLSHPFSC
jgi:hypothetical protein